MNRDGGASRFRFTGGAPFSLTSSPLTLPSGVSGDLVTPPRIWLIHPVMDGIGLDRGGSATTTVVGPMPGAMVGPMPGGEAGSRSDRSTVALLSTLRVGAWPRCELAIPEPRDPRRRGLRLRKMTIAKTRATSRMTPTAGSQKPNTVDRQRVLTY